MLHPEKCILAFSVLILFSVDAVLAQGTDFIYLYDRPKSLGPMPSSVALPTALPSPKFNIEDALVRAEERSIKLANLLDVELDTKNTQINVDHHQEIYRVKDQRYRFKTYVPSGMMKFRDSKLYNKLNPSIDSENKIIGNKEAVEKTKSLLLSFSNSGLIQYNQLFFDGIRISHRKEQNSRGARENESVKIETSPSVASDTRVFVPRVFKGVGISGNGVGITYSPLGEIVGVDLFWRDLAFENPPLRVRISLNEAKLSFEKEIDKQDNSKVEVLVSDLVYFDPSKRDPVAYLEPSYLFVYQVKTPLSHSEEYSVSKITHKFYPAVAHGRKQLDSNRNSRLKSISGDEKNSNSSDLPSLKEILEEDVD